MVHDLGNLFRQLGMSGDVENIDAFLATYHLEPGIRLSEANFWNSSQSHFLMSAISDDSNWAIAADELSTRLS